MIDCMVYFTVESLLIESWSSCLVSTDTYLNIIECKPKKMLYLAVLSIPDYHQTSLTRLLLYEIIWL